MKIFITGANGFLGKALTNYYANTGNDVFALCRKNIFNHVNIKHSYFSLGDSIEKNLPEPDICIHCAYDLTLTKWNEIYEKNVNGTLKLLKELKTLNCKTIIYISSISAYEGCKSKYGKAKLLTENLVLKNNGISIRAGLIIGGEINGLIGKLKSFSKSPILPLIGNGKYPIYIIQINDLIHIIDGIIIKKYHLSEKIITLASNDKRSLKDILKQFNERIILIPLYWKIVYYGLVFLEFFKLNIAFKSDNVKSLVFQNKNPNFTFMNENNINL